MFRHRKTRHPFPKKCSLAQRFVAFLLTLLVAVLVFDPLWECHDHLDDIRHLGAHGVLLILLIIACSGISLLKNFTLAPPSLAGIILRGTLPDLLPAGPVGASAVLATVAAPGSAGLPLRI